MSEAQNTKVVQDAYAAFGRGDIPAVLSAFDDNITWHAAMGATRHPLSNERRGKAAVAEFFKTLPQVQTFEQFEPREFIAQGDKVVALGHYRAKTPGGKHFDSDWAMVFTLRNGKVVQFREFADSAAINAAF
jgi:hypothetical protein